MSDQKPGTIIVVGSQKGGVVKTQSTNEITSNMQRMGFKTLSIDFDMTAGTTERTFPDGLPLSIDKEPMGNAFAPGEANAYQLFFPDTEVRPHVLEDGRHIIGATSELNEINYRPQDCVFDFKDRMADLRKEYDYIFIDSAPAYNNVMIASHIVTDYLIIPTLLEKQSRIAVGKQLSYMHRIRKNYNPDLQFLGTYVTQASVQSYNAELLNGYLTAVETENLERLYDILAENNYGPESVIGFISWVKNIAKEAIEMGQTFREYAPGSKPALQYQELTEKIITMTGRTV